MAVRSCTSYFPERIIDNAVKGDASAIVSILKHYDKYIRRYATRTVYDAQGNQYQYFDEDLAEEIKIKIALHVHEFKG